MQLIQQTFYQAFHNQYINPQRADDFAVNHPYILNVISTIFFNCIEGGMWYLYGSLAKTSAVSCAKVIVISNIIRDSLLSCVFLLRGQVSREDYEKAIGIAYGIVGVTTFEYLRAAKLIGPIGAIAFLALTILKVGIQFTVVDG